LLEQLSKVIAPISYQPNSRIRLARHRDFATLSTFHPLCYQALGLDIAHDPSRLHRPKRFRGGLKDRVSRCVEVETALPFDS